MVNTNTLAQRGRASVQVPRDLWKRTQRVALEMDVNAIQILVEALDVRVAQLEKKLEAKRAA